MLRSIKYELIPTEVEKVKLNQFFGSVRFIYNWGLDLRKTSFEHGIKITFNKSCNILTQLKKIDQFNWLKHVPSQIQQQSLKNLDDAYVNFFKDKSNYPKFKSRKTNQSFRIPQRIIINYQNYSILLPKIGYVKFFKDKRIEGNLKFAVVTKTNTGRYFISITFETKTIKRHGKGSIGIDVGIKNLVTTSTGEIFENQRYLEKNLKKLRIAQRKLQKRYVQGQYDQSNGWKKQKLIVSKLYEKIKNQRKDHLHKVSTKIANQYETVCVENLSIEKMMKNKNMSRSISDCGWGIFIKFLSYKSDNFILIGKFEPSSQLCSVCDYRNRDLKLIERTWKCPECGELHDRDINAAKNIKKIGLRSQPLSVKVEQ